MDISETLVQVKSALSRGRPDGGVVKDWSGLNQWPCESADVVAATTGNEEEMNWLVDMTQAEFLDDRDVLFDKMETISPDGGSLS